MAYYLAESPVQYVAEERGILPPTLAAHQPPRGWHRGWDRRRRLRRGRPPLNYRRYPTVGVPVAVDMERSPGASGLGQLPVDMGRLPFNLQVLKTMDPTSRPPGPPTLVDTLLKLWNQRPESLKRLRFRLNPTRLMQTVQTVVPGKTVAQAAAAMRAAGITPTMLTAGGEVGITPELARAGYEAAGVDWKSYVPWVIGGGVILVGVWALRK